MPSAESAVDTSATPAPSPRPTGLRRHWKPALLALSASMVAGALLLGGTALWLMPQLPPLDRVTDYQPRQPLAVVTSDGVEIAQFGAERRQFVPIAEIPKLMRDALLSVEDTRFYEHHGIDPKGLARAVVAMATGGMRQGASTITQQVARTFFLSPRITAERKLKEALLSLQIEQRLSKDQILELYMNQIYLGQRAYGFAAASQVYFGKPLTALSVAEAAMLAGLPQNPNYANPIVNLERARQRQRIVLKRMLDTGVIDQPQWAAAREQVLRIRTPASGGDLHAEYVAEMARKLVVDRFGPDVYSQGIRVVTSLRAADQAAAWTSLRRGVLDHDRKQEWRGPEDHEPLSDKLSGSELERAAALALREHPDDENLRVAIVLSAGPREVVAQLATGETVKLSGEGLRWAQPGLNAKAPADLQIHRGSVIRVLRVERPKAEPTWSISQWPEAEAALVSMDPVTGRVRAWVGGFDFRQQPFDHVSKAWRQPGSSFKPFLYSAALERGVMPATQILDAPLTGPATEGGWNPQNSDGKFDGPLTLRQALVKSKNLVSVRLLQHIGLGPARDWIARFGFDLARQPDNLTLALGAGSTTPLQMAQAYAMLANGGRQVAPVVIERITDARGQVLFEAAPANTAAAESAEPMIPARNLFIVNSLLNDVTRVGTAAKAQAQLGRSDLFGKTGTTNDAVDAWFAGYQPGLVAVVWMGHDEPRSLGEHESGGGLALPIWIGYMRQALAGVPVQPPPAPPDGVVRASRMPSEGSGEPSPEDWVYSEFASGGQVEHIGIDEAVAPPPSTAAAAAAAPVPQPNPR